jgi:predicted transcriptional regulator
VTAPEEYLSRPAVAELLGVTRAAIAKRVHMPAPDAVILGTGNHRTLGWKRETIEQWARDQGQDLLEADEQAADTQ